MKALPAALAAALLASAPAQAAAPWSPPVDASPTGHPSAPLIAFDAEGRSLLAYGTVDGIRSTTHVVTASGERRLRGAPTGLERSGDRAFLVMRRNGNRVLLAGLRSDGGGRSRRVTRHAADHALAANVRGRAAVAWIDARRVDDNAVHARLAGRRGGLGRRMTVGRTHRAADVDVAVGARGQVAVVWAEQSGARRRVLVRLLDRGARRFGRTLRLGPHAGQTQIDAAFTPSGRLVVAYTSQDFGEEADRPLDVRWATVAAAGRRVGARGLLERGAVPERPVGRLRLEAAADGTTTVVYSAPVSVTADGDPGSVVRTAGAGPGGRLRAPSTLADDAALGDLAQSPTGALLATWMGVEGPGWSGVWTGIGAALKPLGRSFSTPEEIAGDETVGLPAAAFSPPTGRPTAVWSGAPDPDAPSRIRASERRD